MRVLDTAKILFVTLSGAGPPFARLYLIPKSFLGPVLSTLRGDQVVRFVRGEFLPPGL